jgi:hypothetical protein
VILKLFKADLVPILIPVRGKYTETREVLERWVGKADRVELYRSLDSLRPCQSWEPAIGRRGWTRSESI